MTAVEERATVLEDEIMRALDAGIADPHVIAAKIVRDHDDAWLAAQLLPRAEDVIGEIARQLLGRVRRSATAGREPSPTRLSRYARDFLDTPVYLGDGIWKLHGDLTADDCRLVADLYRVEAATLTEYAARYEGYARLIEEQHAATLRDVQGLAE